VATATETCAVDVSPSASTTVNTASYAPAVVYVCVGFGMPAFSPSPKSQEYVNVPSPPETYDWKCTGSGARPAAGSASAFTVGIESGSTDTSTVAVATILSLVRVAVTSAWYVPAVM
jgi:hypothetical protein